MARHIHVHLTQDGAFNENDHPRSPNGKFGSGGGGGGSKTKTTPVKPTKAGTNLLASHLRNENEKADAKKGKPASGKPANAPAAKSAASPASAPAKPKSDRVQRLEKWKARYEELVKSEKDPKKKAEYESDLRDFTEELKDATRDSSFCGCGGSTKGT